MAKQTVNKETGEVSVDKANVLVSFKPSRTKQAMREATDINKIVARGRQVGYLPPMSRPPVYGDVSEVPSYEEAFNRVVAAQEAFQRLPAQVRDALGHDPKNLVPFLKDEKNREAAEKYGLLKPREKQTNETQNEKINTPEKKGAPPPPPPPKPVA